MSSRGTLNHMHFQRSKSSYQTITHLDLHDAVEFIRPAIPEAKGESAWADLGSGSGLFTRALATLVGRGSTIHAVDRSRQKMLPSFNGNTIVFHQLDFIKDTLPFAGLDGILMANSMHFVKDKRSLLTRLRQTLRHEGRLLVIEYELEKGNEWVPYPIPYEALALLLTDSGFSEISRIGERHSVYGSRKMYACTALKC